MALSGKRGHHFIAQAFIEETVARMQKSALKNQPVNAAQAKIVLATCPNMIEALINKQNITVHF